MDDVLKVRIDVREKRGGWEELVDNRTGKTFYYNEGRDEIRFKKPKNWVSMLAKRFESGTLFKRQHM